MKTDMTAPEGARRPPPPPLLPPAAAPPASDELLLAGQVGAEIAAVLSSALGRVRLLAETGRIGRQSLDALQDELRQARQIAIVGQQVSRLAAGHVRQAPELLELPQLLREALGQRREEIAARGLEIRQRLQPAAVSVDASLLFTLLVSLLDWAFEHCRGASVRLDCDLNPWPVHARLHCEFAWRTPDHVRPEDELALAAEREARAGSPLDTMAWRLVQHAARAMGVALERHDTAQRVRLTLAFPEAPRRWPRLVDALAAMEDPFAARHRPLADCEVLLLATRPEMRRLVHEAVTGMGLVLRVARDLAEAREMAQESPPHALLVDARNPEVDRFIGELKAGSSGPALLHVSEAFQGVEVCTGRRFEIVRVARDGIVKELPAALGYALNRA
ncbi:MAG: hypothetical protein Fur0014_13060 [Rubrivivax sp.]